MKRISLVIALLVIIIPLPALAWPLALHDDGGPYQALAVTHAPGLVIAGVATPTTIELTATSPSGLRLGWHTVELPHELWDLPVRKVWLQLETIRSNQQRLTVMLISGTDQELTTGYRWVIRVTHSSSQATFTQANGPASFMVPPAAVDAAVWWIGRRGYIVWLTLTEDNIGTVQLTTLVL